MKQTLPDYIKQNEDFQQALLNMSGGFIRFFVRHSENEDVNGTWYQRYQEYVFSNYCKANSIDPDVMLLSQDEQRKKALGGSHMREEFRQRKELEKILSQMPKEAAEAVQEVQHLADGYLAFAFHQHIERCNPDHATDVGFYRSVIEHYTPSDGLFYRCMNIVLKEHHGYGLTEDDQYDAYRILEYRHFYLRSDDCYARLRRAVKEILSKRDVDPQREIDYLLNGVRNFAQHVHTNLCVESVRSQAKEMKDPEARKDTMQRADQQESDGRWLRQQVGEWHERDTMLFCFAWFVDVLKHLSHIWAARLLRYHKIDMHKIEVENDCVMNPNYRPGPDGFDPYYYVDHHYKGERPDECCVADKEEAEGLLSKIKPDTPSDEEKLQRLEATNTVIITHNKMGKQVVNLLELYRFLLLHFAEYVQHKYEWYALRRFLQKYDLEKEGVDNVEFEKQMNHPDWFGNLEDKKKCSQSEMNNYNFLKALEPDEWRTKWNKKNFSQKARQEGVDNIYKMFNHLDYYLPFFKEMITKV